MTPGKLPRIKHNKDKQDLSWKVSDLSQSFPGGTPYKNDSGARQKFSNERLKVTRISISGRGPN